MTAPVNPIIIQQPGVGQSIQQAGDSILTALQARQQMQLRQQQIDLQARQLQQQQESQQRSQTFNMLIEGIRADPNFASTPEAQQLAQFLGSRMGQFPQALANTMKRSAQQARSAFEGLFAEGTDTTPAGPLAGLSVGAQKGVRALHAVESDMGITLGAEQATRIFSEFAGDAPLGELDQARLEQIRLENAKLRRDLATIRNPTVQDQITVAQRLARSRVIGLNEEEAVTFATAGVSFVDIAQTLLERKEDDPGKLLASMTMQFLGAFVNPFTGELNATPATAFEAARSVVGTIYPSVAGTPLGPDLEAQITVGSSVYGQLQQIRAAGNRDAAGSRLTEKDVESLLRDFINAQGTTMPATVVDVLIRDALDRLPRESR